MEEIKEIIKKLSGLEKIRGVILMDFRGKILESTLEKNDKDKIREQALFELISNGKQFGEKMELGNMKSSYLEFPEFISSCEIIGDKGILGVIADVGANMGRFRMMAKKNRKQILELLSS